MVKKNKEQLVSKAEFARMAGVSAGAVTKAIRGGLSVAMQGKRINANHPLAAEYVKSKTEEKPESPAAGIDPLYEDAIRHCQSNNRFTASNIQRGLKIGYNRAASILTMMTAAGINSETPAVKQPEEKPHVRGTAAKNEKRKKATPETIDPEAMLLEIPEDITAFADMSLRELVTRFGTDIRFLDWLKSIKMIEDINEKRLKNAVAKGELVSRDLVKLGIIDPIESAHIKLLTDGAKTIARRATAMHSAERPLDDVEKFVKDQITSFIRPIKAKVARTLNQLNNV